MSIAVRLSEISEEVRASRLNFNSGGKCNALVAAIQVDSWQKKVLLLVGWIFGRRNARTFQNSSVTPLALSSLIMEEVLWIQAEFIARVSPTSFFRSVLLVPGSQQHGME